MAALKKVRSGDPLVIPATTFNAFVDAARDIADRRNSAQLDPGRDYRQAGIVLVRNESDADRVRCEVLGIAGPIVEPADNADEFMERVALKGVVPGSEHVGRFAVLLEPLAQNTIGRACVSGVTAVRIAMQAATDVCADIEPDNPTKLRSGSAGAAAILWAETAGSYPADVWGVVRIGAGSAGITCARITVIYGAGSKQFKCRVLDAAGNPTGDEFIVNAFSKGTTQGVIGQEDLTICLPNYIVGDQIRIQQQTVWTGTAWITGWWTVDTFTKYGCQAQQ